MPKKVSVFVCKETRTENKVVAFMAVTEYIEQRQLAENQAEMLKIQQEISKSKARAEVYGKHNTEFINGRSQLSNDKINKGGSSK